MLKFLSSGPIHEPIGQQHCGHASPDGHVLAIDACLNTPLISTVNV